MALPMHKAFREYHTFAQHKSQMLEALGVFFITSLSKEVPPFYKYSRAEL
jgi:hypothetical protein